MSPKDEGTLVQEWFDIVHEKNVLLSYESELAIQSVIQAANYVSFYRDL